MIEPITFTPAEALLFAVGLALYLVICVAGYRDMSGIERWPDDAPAPSKGCDCVPLQQFTPRSE